MNINHSSLPKYKSNKNSLHRNPSEVRSTSETAATKASSSHSALKPYELKSGQQFKGEIIDHRLREVSIRFENSPQTITAKLEGDVLLSIGQEARFEVIESGTGKVVLKHVPENGAVIADSTIQKALMASGFPNNDRNRAIVGELLSHRMPIDKGTLQTLLRLSIMNKEASPLTLVLMYKNNIKMSSENIRQFEAYQRGTHPMLDSLKAIAEQLTTLIRSEQLLQTTDKTSDGTVNAVLQTNQNLLDILYSTDRNNQGVGAPLSTYMDIEQLHLLNQALVQPRTGDLSPLPSLDILQGNETLQEAFHKLWNLFGQNEEEFRPEVLLQTIKNKLNPSEAVLQSLTKLFDPLPMDNQALISLSDGKSSGEMSAKAPFSMTLMPSASLSDLLSISERNALLEHIRVLPVSEDFKAQITAGTISTKDVLMYLQRLLVSSQDSSTLEVLLTPEYRSLLEKALLSKWTLTPERLSEDNSLRELYQGLQEDAEKLSQLTQAGKEYLAKASLSEPVNQLKENLNFMKALNEIFTYVQLPVSFKDKKLHSDLYVFTNKKSLGKKNEGLSVLLHLTMTHLGSMNVHIHMLHKNIRLKFMAEHSDTRELMKANLSQIEEALKNKGYQAYIEVETAYKKPDFSRDFIEQGEDEQPLNRYTFDIRT